MRPTCNEPFPYPYDHGPSPSTGGPNFGYRAQAYGEPQAPNPSTWADGSIARTQSYRADVVPPPSTALQPSASATTFAGYFAQQGTTDWKFDAQRRMWYYVDYSGKSCMKLISVYMLIGYTWETPIAPNTNTKMEQSCETGVESVKKTGRRGRRLMELSNAIWILCSVFAAHDDV